MRDFGNGGDGAGFGAIASESLYRYEGRDTFGDDKDGTTLEKNRFPNCGDLIEIMARLGIEEGGLWRVEADCEE